MGRTQGKQDRSRTDKGTGGARRTLDRQDISVEYAACPRPATLFVRSCEQLCVRSVDSDNRLHACAHVPTVRLRRRVRRVLIKDCCSRVPEKAKACARCGALEHVYRDAKAGPAEPPARISSHLLLWASSAHEHSCGPGMCLARALARTWGVGRGWDDEAITKTSGRGEPG